MGSHEPATWHSSLAGHVTVLVAVHTPLAHADVAAQRFPLLAHAVPSGAGGLEHCPVVASQVERPLTARAHLEAQHVDREALPGGEIAHLEAEVSEANVVTHRRSR